MRGGDIMTWIKAKLPILYSPRFWGVVMTFAFWFLQKKGLVIDQELAGALAGTSGTATFIGVLNWLIKKMSTPQVKE